MGKLTKIEWADHTWNPWVGCTQISEGCDHCYMFREMGRFGSNPTEIRKTKKMWAPEKWEPGRIFVCSWSDYFHPDVPMDWRMEAMNVMHMNDQHTFMILTKRPGNITRMSTPEFWKWSPNVWLGVTAENQRTADLRIPHLREIPAAVKFVSFEPLLEYVDISAYTDVIDWAIVGGESGPGFRHMNTNWARFILDQCKSNRPRIKYFMKQMSGNTKKAREAIPEELMVREFPGGE